MRAIKMTMLAAGLLTACITVKAQTADEIMDKHEQAVGGLDNWNKIKTAKMTGTLMQQGMEIKMTQTYLVEKAMRMDISVMGMNGFMILTPTAGWNYMPFGGATKIDTLKPEVVKLSQDKINLKGMQMLDYKTNGTKVELAGRDTINNAPCYKLKCTSKEGETSYCYMDISTYYISRIERTVKQDDQEQEMSVAFSNYQKQPEGIVLPMSLTTQGVEINYSSVEINKPVDEKIFIPTIDK